MDDSLYEASICPFISWHFGKHLITEKEHLLMKLKSNLVLEGAFSSILCDYR